jgi:hypothetical protein
MMRHKGKYFFISVMRDVQDVQVSRSAWIRVSDPQREFVYE